MLANGEQNATGVSTFAFGGGRACGEIAGRPSRMRAFISVILSDCNISCALRIGERSRGGSVKVNSGERALLL